MKLQPNVGSDRSWVWKVAADYSEDPPTSETLAIRFANSDCTSLVNSAPIHNQPSAWQSPMISRRPSKRPRNPTQNYHPSLLPPRSQNPPPQRSRRKKKKWQRPRRRLRKRRKSKFYPIGIGSELLYTDCRELMSSVHPHGKKCGVEMLNSHGNSSPNNLSSSANAFHATAPSLCGHVKGGTFPSTTDRVIRTCRISLSKTLSEDRLVQPSQLTEPLRGRPIVSSEFQYDIRGILTVLRTLGLRGWIPTDTSSVTANSRPRRWIP